VTADDEARVAALHSQVQARLDAVRAMQARPWWWRLWHYRREQALIGQAECLLEQVDRLIGGTAVPAPPAPLPCWRHPLLWWWIQQINGVWLAYELLLVLGQQQWWLVVVNLVCLLITSSWRVPPYQRCKQGKWGI
jgi:hypothetical protein